MSNHLTDVSASPIPLKSGLPTQVSVDYESDNGGPLHISCGAGFTLSPTSQTLNAAASGSITFPLTITRNGATTKSCRVVFSFFVSEREVLVEIV
jgi:hypothetical protein